jgi:hypothetical protein
MITRAVLKIRSAAIWLLVLLAASPLLAQQPSPENAISKSMG